MPLTTASSSVSGRESRPTGSRPCRVTTWLFSYRNIDSPTRGSSIRSCPLAGVCSTFKQETQTLIKPLGRFTRQALFGGTCIENDPALAGIRSECRDKSFFRRTCHRHGFPIYLRVNGLASLIIWPFSIALAFFVCQPWAPDVFGVPIQVILVWSCFLWVIMFHPSSLVRTGMIFSPFQWILISLLVGSAFLRAYLDGWQAIRLIQICTGLMIAVLGSMIFRTRRRPPGDVRHPGTQALLPAVALPSCGISVTVALGVDPVQPGRQLCVCGSSGMEGTPVSFSFSVLTSVWSWRHPGSCSTTNRSSCSSLPTGISSSAVRSSPQAFFSVKAVRASPGFTVGVVVILLITSTAFLRERRQMTSDDPSESRGKGPAEVLCAPSFASSSWFL